MTGVVACWCGPLPVAQLGLKRQTPDGEGDGRGNWTGDACRQTCTAVIVAGPTGDRPTVAAAAAAL